MKMNSKEIKEFRKEWSNPNRFETTYKMKEATNKKQAIISILDVLTENPLFLEKCTSNMFGLVYNLHTTKKREEWLKLCSWIEVRDLFIEIKTQYYNSLDFTNKF